MLYIILLVVVINFGTAFSKILMDDEGIAHIPDDMIHSKTTESDSCFVRVF